MELPGQAFTRLLVALEELVAREATQVAAGDPAGILRTQQRTSAVVDHLARLGAGEADASARERVAVLLKQRERIQGVIAAQMERIRGKLSCAQASLQRVALIAPAYRGRANPGVARRLSALG
jgi:hypothetical protein